jgi:hypothetical protein
MISCRGASSRSNCGEDEASMADMDALSEASEATDVVARREQRRLRPLSRDR